MKAAIVAAAIGGIFAVVEGLLLIVLGSLAGLADNPEGEAAMTDSYVVLTLGAIVLAAVFVATAMAAPPPGRERVYRRRWIPCRECSMGLRCRLPSRCRGPCRYLEAQRTAIRQSQRQALVVGEARGSGPFV
jgi:hypothetical protein